MPGPGLVPGHGSVLTGGAGACFWSSALGSVDTGTLAVGGSTEPEGGGATEDCWSPAPPGGGGVVTGFVAGTTKLERDWLTGTDAAGCGVFISAGVTSILACKVNPAPNLIQDNYSNCS